MSRIDPIMQFLGVPQDADELDLLGIHPAYVSQAGIQAALAARLALVFDHPNGRSAEADAVRARLRDAADRLLDEELRAQILADHVSVVASRPVPIEVLPVQRASSPGLERAEAERPVLSPLQTRLLAVLAGCGGWNAESRARLSAVAAEHQLVPEDLLIILEELAQAMHAGARIAPRESSSAATVSARAMEPGFLERVIDQYAPELRQDDSRSVVKLCLLFAGIGLLALVLMYRVLFPGQQPIAPEGPGGTLASSSTADVGASRIDDVVVEDGGVVPMAAFGAMPTLQLREVDPAVHDAVDAAAATVRSIDAFARRCIGLRELEDGMLDEWKQLLLLASTGWFHTDPATAQAMRRAVVRVMEHAGADPALFRPLQLAFALVPPESIRSPLAVPRGAWRVGTMAMIARGSGVSPAARANATRLLQTIGIGESSGAAFAPAAADWLTRMVPSLISRTETTDEVVNEWSMWFACVRALPEGIGQQEALLAALPALLRTETNLGRRGPTQRVLGRVLAELEWEQAGAVQPVFLGLFDDAEVTSTDLWVLTSLMANLDETSWYKPSFVLAPEASDGDRRKLRDAVLANWPSQARGVLAMGDISLADVDPVLAETWQLVWKQVRALPASRTEMGQLDRILIERLLQESAVDLFIGNGQRVLGALNEVESLLQQSAAPADAAGGGSSVAPMIPGGQFDGHWARSYTARSLSKGDRLDLIRALEVQSGSDLGPLDAAVLASEALGATLDVREAASYLIERKFSQSPNVALALVDQFPGAGRIAGARDVSELIENVTGAVLPKSNSATWPVEARLALVRHAMDLRLVEAGAVDALAAKIAASLQGEAMLLDRMVESAASPADSARQLTAAWQDHVVGDARTRTIPVDWLDRRSARAMFASDSIQRCLVERIATTELIHSLLSAWLPSRQTNFDAFLAAAHEGRLASSHVLEQFVWTETMLVEIWSVLIEAALAQHRTGGGA